MVHLDREVVHFLLSLIHVLAECLCVLPVAGLAGAIDLGQRTLHMVVGVLDATLLHVRHVAVGAT